MCEPLGRPGLVQDVAENMFEDNMENPVVKMPALASLRGFVEGADCAD